MSKKEFDFDEFDQVEEQSIDLRKYATVLSKHWKTVLIWACVAAVIGFVWAASTPKEYTTKAIVAPEITTRASSSGLSSLASLAGINMNSMAVTDAMHPDLYPVIVKSTSFLSSLFDVPVECKDRKGNTVKTDLYDYMANYEKRPWFGAVLGFPHMVADWVKRIFSKKDDFDDAEGYAHMNPYKLTKQQEMVVKGLAKNVEATVDRKTYALTLKVTTQDKDITALLANAIIDRLQTFVQEYRQERAQYNVDYYQKLYEEAQNDYMTSQRRYAQYVDSHQGLVQKSVQVELQNLQNDANLKYQVYNQTVQNLTSARAKLQLDAPVLVVIQPGIAPHKGTPSKLKMMVAFFILGACAGATWVIIRKKDEKQA